MYKIITTQPNTNLDFLLLLESGDGDLLMMILLVSPANADDDDPTAAAVEEDEARGDFDLTRGDLDRARDGGGDRLDLRVVEEAAVGGEGRLGDLLERLGDLLERLGDRLERLLDDESGDGERWAR